MHLHCSCIKQADGDDQFIVRGLTVVRQRRLQRFRDFFLATLTLKSQSEYLKYVQPLTAPLFLILAPPTQ